MRLYLLLPTVRTAAPYLNPFKSYSKNTHQPFFFKWALVCILFLSNFFHDKTVWIYFISSMFSFHTEVKANDVDIKTIIENNFHVFFSFLQMRMYMSK
jgi:hypothetical protein